MNLKKIVVIGFILLLAISFCKVHAEDSVRQRKPKKATFVAFNKSEHNQITINLTKKAKKENITLGKFPTNDGRIIEIQGPPKYLDKCPKYFNDLQSAKNFVTNLTGKKLDFDILMVILEIPSPNVNYKYAHTIKNPPFSDHLEIYPAFLIEVTNATDEEKEKNWEMLLGVNVHEMTHGRVFKLSSALLKWEPFEEGFCEYSATRWFEFKGSTETVKKKEGAIKAFKDAKIREKLWEPMKMGQPVFYDGALGIYLYLEERLGREKLEEIIKELVKENFTTQDEKFFKWLESKTGFDIRKVTQEEIEETFKEVK